MNNEKDYSKEFKFTLHQGNVLICEKIFDADLFNPFTRNFIDIRGILPRAITRLQKTLSKKSYNTKITDDFDLYQYYQKMVNTYSQGKRYDMRYNPQPVVQQIAQDQEYKTIKGVECKIGFYINEKPIVERVFYVDGFNPVVRWSTDIVDVMNEIGDNIFNAIKMKDVDNMWDDYDLINVMGLSITQIRELQPYKREELLVLKNFSYAEREKVSKVLKELSYNDRCEYIKALKKANS